MAKILSLEEWDCAAHQIPKTVIRPKGYNQLCSKENLECNQIPWRSLGRKSQQFKSYCTRSSRFNTSPQHMLHNLIWMLPGLSAVFLRPTFFLTQMCKCLSQRLLCFYGRRRKSVLERTASRSGYYASTLFSSLCCLYHQSVRKN